MVFWDCWADLLLTVGIGSGCVLLVERVCCGLGGSSDIYIGGVVVLEWKDVIKFCTKSVGRSDKLGEVISAGDEG